MTGTTLRRFTWAAAVGCAIVVTCGWATGAMAAEPVEKSASTVRIIEFEGEIEPALSAYVRRSIESALADHASGIVLAIDSPGGRVDSCLEIVEALLAVPKGVRTTAWVEHEAISAACICALACDEIVMAPSATLGDCQPILRTGDSGFVPAGEKIETYLRSQVRRIAEAKGWEPVLVEKLVSKDRAVIELRVAKGAGVDRHFYAYGDEFESARDHDLIEGHQKLDLERVAVAIPDGRLLTLTTSEAQRFKFVTRTFPNTKAFEASLSADGATLEHVEMSGSERAGRWLLDVAGALAGIIMLCVMLTVYRGIGTPAIIGLVALALLGLVSVTADLSNGLPWFLVGIGVILLLIEAFVLTGTAIPGIVGILAMLTGFLFLVSGTTLERKGSLSFDGSRSFLLQAILSIGATAALFFALAKFFPKLPFGGRALVAGAQGLDAFGPAAPVGVRVATGARGVASTDLRPAGRAHFGLGAPDIVDVVSEGMFIEEGTALEVVRVEGHRVVVRSVGVRPSNGTPA